MSRSTEEPRSRESRGGGAPPLAQTLARLLEALAREEPAAVELRHRLHAHPETAHREEWTAAAVEQAMPVPCTPVAGTGRLALVGPRDPGAGAPVAVRAELDGLPLAERTGAPYSARGEAMHACGHDVHMAALVALARAAHALGEQAPAPLLATFQPSEEAYPSGAQELADGALAEHAPRAIVAAHVHPELPWGTAALDAGAVNASCDGVTVTVEGEPTHGAYPHRGRDPILALAHTIVALYAQAPRRIDPLYPATLTIGVVEAGAAENATPAQASARGTLRAHRAADRETLRATVTEVAEGVAAAHGCRARVTLTPGEPPLENDARIVAGARELWHAAGLRPAPQWRSCGSDDLAFLGALAPLALAFVGLEGAPDFTPRPLHHPELLPPDAAVGAIARAQAVLYVAAAAAV
jgi:amidohydrolase